jgi:hypothetical protein
MLRATWNPSGGITYHLRAWRRRERAWRPFREALESWLGDWQPNATTLAIVGPSGGYCLPLRALARFERFVIFEPDPIARFILARRLRAAYGERPITWVTHDVWVEPVRRGGSIPAALLPSSSALLFTNILGQLPFLIDSARWSDFCANWQRSLFPVLERVPWASFHDRVSGRFAPRQVFPAHQRKLSDDEVCALFASAEPDQADNVVELLDHSTELLPQGKSYRYFDWALLPDAHHLIEGVIGGP